MIAEKHTHQASGERAMVLSWLAFMFRSWVHHFRLAFKCQCYMCLWVVSSDNYISPESPPSLSSSCYKYVCPIAGWIRHIILCKSSDQRLSEVPFTNNTVDSSIPVSAVF